MVSEPRKDSNLTSIRLTGIQHGKLGHVHFVKKLLSLIWIESMVHHVQDPELPSK